MVTFAGVDHVSLTVTDLEVSEAFYREVLDFVPVLDVGHGRICMHPMTGFILALLKPPAAQGGTFSELNTGLDHLGFSADSRAELEEWERRLAAKGVAYTPIRDMEMGHHLNFRDPDGIALELTAANDLLREARRLMASQVPDRDRIADFVSENLDPDLVPR